MHCKSARTKITEAYRAGDEIGTVLLDISPEVIIFFASINYAEELAEFFDGLRERLGSRDVLIFGGTGDGIYETTGAANYGITALGINSAGKLKWRISAETGVAADSFLAARDCAAKLVSPADGDPDFAFVLADGVKADGTGIAAGIQSVMKIPFFGGLAGDDRKFKTSRIITNGLVYEDAVAILAAKGGIAFSVNAASGWTPVGEPGVIEAHERNTIKRISGVPAQAFMKEQLGKPIGEADLGMIPLAAYDEEEEHFSLRSPLNYDMISGAITTFGSIAEGTVVRICTATREGVIEGAKEALDRVMPADFAPCAALVVSCAGRKWLMDDRADEELAQVFSALGKKIPLIGFPSFGEISPFRRSDGSYTSVFFHNVTFVICLIGS